MGEALNSPAAPAVEPVTMGCGIGVFGFRLLEREENDLAWVMALVSDG